MISSKSMSYSNSVINILCNVELKQLVDYMNLKIMQQQFWGLIIFLSVFEQNWRFPALFWP